MVCTFDREGPRFGVSLVVDYDVTTCAFFHKLPARTGRKEQCIYFMSVSMISVRVLKPESLLTIARKRALLIRLVLPKHRERREFTSKIKAKAKHTTAKAQKAPDSRSPHISKMPKRTSYEQSGIGHPSTKRAKQVDEDRPFDNLTQLLEDQEESKKVTKVAHWFRPKDLRIHDNTGLHHASHLAQESKKPLICIYLHCPAEESWHGTSPARMDFMLEGLRLMQEELKALNIPLCSWNHKSGRATFPLSRSS